MTDVSRYQTASIGADLVLNQEESAIALSPQVTSHPIATSQRYSDDSSAVPLNASNQPFIDLRDRIPPELLRVLAIGSPQVVEDCVMTLFRLGYARPEEWSQQLPTANPGEVMRILTKRVMLSE